MNSSGSSDIDVSRRMGLACIAVHRISKSQVTLSSEHNYVLSVLLITQKPR